MAPIVHIPETIAESPSPLRELAYLEDIPIALPVLDSGGWKLLPPVEAVGTLIPNANMTVQLSIANPVRPCFSYLTAIDVHFIRDSCHLHWAHRYRYSSSYLITGLQTLTSTRLMFVSFAPSLLAVSPVACASLTLHAQRFGQLQATLLTGLNYGGKLSLAGVLRQALFSQNARCRYIHSLPASLRQWI
jgi:hypothetical protein